MAKTSTGPGAYQPHSWRARRLIAQLRRATHRTVQNAIIQELIHELERGSRRARKQASWLRAKAKEQARRHAGRAGAALRKKAGEVVRTARYGRLHHCAGCSKDFRNKLQFDAHARSHQEQVQVTRGRVKRERDPQAANGRQPKAPAPARQKGKDRAAFEQWGGDMRARDLRENGQRPAREAQAHARNVMEAAGPKVHAAVGKVSRQATATGVPAGRKDLKRLKDLGKKVTEARNAPPSRTRATPAAKPAAAARTPATPKVTRAPRPAPAATVRPPRVPSAAPKLPVRPRS